MPDTTSSPGVGAPAPDFTLPSTAGVDVTLSSFRGKQNVLLAFFPLAFTSTCTAENCAFTEDYEQFAGADTVVLPISVDSVPTLKEYRAKYADAAGPAERLQARRVPPLWHAARRQVLLEPRLLPDRQAAA